MKQMCHLCDSLFPFKFFLVECKWTAPKKILVAIRKYAFPCEIRLCWYFLMDKFFYFSILPLLWTNILYFLYEFRQNVGVFVCGPRKMTSRVHRLCNRLNRNKAQLHFNQESFSWSYQHFDCRWWFTPSILVFHI